MLKAYQSSFQCVFPYTDIENGGKEMLQRPPSHLTVDDIKGMRTEQMEARMVDSEKKIYAIDTLIKTFRQHHERSVDLNNKLIKLYKENNPGEPVPDAFSNDFSLPLALAALCEEIQEIKQELDILDAIDTAMSADEPT